MGATTPNPRTCHLLTHRDGLLVLSFIPLSSARREAPLGVLPQEFRQTGSATSHPRPPGVSAMGFSISRKGNFRARDEGASYCPSGYLLINQALLDARHEKPDGAIGVGQPPV